MCGFRIGAQMHDRDTIFGAQCKISIYGFHLHSKDINTGKLHLVMGCITHCVMHSNFCELKHLTHSLQQIMNHCNYCLLLRP